MSGTLRRPETLPEEILRKRSGEPQLAPYRDPRQAHEFAVEIAYSLDGRPERLTSKDVKSVDRPSIEPVIEQVNQYNKKRLVTTGYKTRPVRMQFFDRRDGKVFRFMTEYLRRYYADFSQTADTWLYDQTYANFNGQTGFRPAPSPQQQFFFESIKVFQALNLQQFDWFELVNPRVTEFDFDEFDYEGVGTAVMMTATFDFEAILFDNGDNQQIRRDVRNSVIDHARDDTTPLPSDGARSASLRRITNLLSSRPNEDAVTRIAGQRAGAPIANSQRAASRPTGSGLSAFGAFGFGNLPGGGGFNVGNTAGVIAGRLATGQGLRGVAGELAFAATDNPILATVLNAANTGRRGRGALAADIGSAVMGSVARPANGASAALFDSVQAGLGAGVYGNRATRGTVASSLVTGLFANGAYTGGGNRGLGRSNAGLYASPSTLGLTNLNQPGYAQFGYNPRVGGPRPDWNSPTGWVDARGNSVPPNGR